jgi:hypothetical protein
MGDRPEANTPRRPEMSAHTSAPQVVGNFVSNNATEVWNQPETSTGQAGVPGLKANCAS